MELLFDDKWIDRAAGVRRVLGCPVKAAQPVLLPERPWEAAGIQAHQALFLDPSAGGYRLYYGSHCPGDAVQAQDPAVASSERDVSPKRHFLCLAESPDGIVWTRPDLGLFEFQGSACNNIVRELEQGDTVYGNILRDEDAPDPSRRYKALGFCRCGRTRLRDTKPGYRGVCVDYSPDGLRWRGAPEMVMSTCDLTDSDMLLPTRDPLIGRWTGFFRPRVHPKRRFIGLSFSDDFERWTFPRMLLTPDASDDHFTEFYGLTAVVVGRFRVGLLWVYHNNPEYSPMTLELVYSRDGFDYRRAMPRVEFLPLGPDGVFDSRMVMSAALIERPGEHWIFYSGRNLEHGSDRGMTMQTDRTPDGGVYRCGVGLARLPWGQFCGLEADLDGVVETKYLANYGDGGVRVIASVEPGGWLRAEVLDQYGQSIPGWDAGRCQVIPEPDGWRRLTWGEGLTGACGQSAPGGGAIGHVVKLRFHLNRATLYGFDVGSEDTRPERA